MRPTILITRPEPKGAAFAANLQARWDQPLHVILSPLLQIVPLDGVLPETEALIFTSANGVEQATRLGAQPGLPTYCVGPATAKAAQNAGFDILMTEGDAASLIAALLELRPPGSLTHIRGQNTIGDIAGHLRKAGLSCSDFVAYDQRPISLTKEAMTALRGKKPVIVPLFSPRTSALLAEYGPFQCPIHGVAISNAALPRIALTSSRVATRKDGEAMCDATIACIRNLTGLSPVA